MKQQIIVSGMGGQGVLFVTKIIAGASVAMGLETFTSETHGMAQRGGSVISFVKVGDFKSPLIRRGQGDLGLFLHSQNLEVHGNLLQKEADFFVNSPEPLAGEGVPANISTIGAASIARDLGSPVYTNLVILGLAAASGKLFCSVEELERSIKKLSGERFSEANLAAFHKGLGK